MATVNMSKAAELAGVSRQTIYNHVKKGILSKNSDGTIDTSELLRVFQTLRVDSQDKPSKDVSGRHKFTDSTCNSDVNLQLALLTQENVFLKDKIERLEAIAEAIATRCFWPPERDMGCLSLKPIKSNLARISSAHS